MRISDWSSDVCSSDLPLLREYRRRFYRRAGMTGTNMTRYPIVAAALFFIFPTAPALASGPSFDCAKATRQLDRAICAWGTVASLDGEMAAVFADWQRGCARSEGRRVGEGCVSTL